MRTVYSHACNADLDMDELYLPEGMMWASTGVYAHGKLQDEIGYDIIYVPIPEYIFDIEDQDERSSKRYDFIKTQVDECFAEDILVKADGKEYQAKGYIYPDRYKPTEGGRLRGLIVLADDTEAVQYATEVYTSKRHHL